MSLSHRRSAYRPPSRSSGPPTLLVVVLAGLALPTAAHGRPLVGGARVQRIELGLSAGAYFPPERHELYSLDAERQHPLNTVGFSFGLRACYMPWPFAGVELEGMLAPIGVRDLDASALVYALRAHLLVQLPQRFTPFALIGGGLQGISADRSAGGSDVDGAFHWGLGFKAYVTRWLAARVEARHDVGGRLGPGGRSSHFEILAGVSYVLSWGHRTRPGGATVSASCHGTSCPTTRPTAAAAPAVDSDGDGVADEHDACPRRAAHTPDGCPADSDGDGLADDRDHCPDRAARTPTGCPPADTDGDSVPDQRDRCPNRAEVKNGFEDDDGCPDELPEELRRLIGVLSGVDFRPNKAELAPSSHRVLDELARLLNSYTDLEIKLTVHTAGDGERSALLALARQRAAAVERYLVSKGIAAGRIHTEARGAADPLVSGATAKARARNERVELQLY